jgi:hypothetical protein
MSLPCHAGTRSSAGDHWHVHCISFLLAITQPMATEAHIVRLSFTSPETTAFIKKKNCYAEQYRRERVHHPRWERISLEKSGIQKERDREGQRVVPEMTTRPGNRDS